MRIALYIENGLEQIVLTPETKTEQNIVGKLHDSERDLSIMRGSFYACQGGWMRQRTQYSDRMYGISPAEEDESTIIVLNEIKETE